MATPAAHPTGVKRPSDSTSPYQILHQYSAPTMCATQAMMSGLHNMVAAQAGAIQTQAARMEKIEQLLDAQQQATPSC